AIRHRAAVAHEVVAVVPLRRLNGAQSLSGWYHRAPAHAQEMSDERFDVVHGPRFHRRCGQRVIPFLGTFRHVVDALLDDAQALSHLFYTYEGARIAIAGLRSGNVELKVFVAGIGLSLAEIPVESAGAKVRPSQTPVDRLIDAVAADAL